MNGICWNRIVGAAARRQVAMPGELAGYLVLGVLDAMGDQRGRVVAEDIQLNEGGRVVLLRVLPCDAGPSDQCLRELLCQILVVSGSPSPALLRITDSSPRIRETTLVTELQTALIPVNRAAARRALSRLHRELLRVKASVDETPESSTHAAEMDAPYGMRYAVAVASPAAPTVQDCLRSLPTVAGVQQLEPVVEVGHAVPVQPGVECQSALEIPDLELLGNVSAAQEQKRLRDASPVTHGNAEEVGEKAVTLITAALAGNQNRNVLTETLMLAPVARVVQPLSYDLPVAANGSDDQSTCAASSPTLRETTLVLAPVAPVAKLEQTLRLHRQATVSSGAATEYVVDTDLSRDALELEPTRALPLVTLKHRARDQALLVESSTRSGDVPEPLDEDGPISVNLSELLELVDHSNDGVTTLVELEKCERQATSAGDVEFCRELTDAHANVVLSNWDATSMDAVVEVGDDEIVYDGIVEEEIWLDVDSSDDGLFEAVAPRVGLLDQAAAFEGRNLSGRSEVVPTGKVTAGTDSRDGHGVEGEVDVDDAEFRVEDRTCFLESECHPESSQTTETEPALSLVGELGAGTHYRCESLNNDGPRSTVEELSTQFGSEPTWSPNELCRNLRFVAGLDHSPSGTSVVTNTPPPTVETILLQQQEHSEPTRRLRRVGSMIALVLAVSASAYGFRAAEGRVIAASRLSVDALGRICRATVTVAGVDAHHQLRIRQAGDEQFRAPTSVANATAHFAGLRCGKDTELLVHDAATAGMRRIPISGDRLLSRDPHPSANVSLDLAGSS